MCENQFNVARYQIFRPQGISYLKTIRIFFYAVAALLIPAFTLNSFGQATVGFKTFDTIQGALDFIQAENLQDAIVLVEPGIYCENLQMPTIGDVTLRSSTPNNPSATRIDGKDIGTTVTMSSNGMLVKHTIDGFQITGGSDSGIVARPGTHLCLNNSDINSNFVEENAVENRGGGIRAIGAIVEINNSTIQDNTAGNGGGIFADGNSTIDVDGNSQVSNNSAFSDGGGFSGEGLIIFRPGSTIEGNTAVLGFGGGGFINEGGQIIVEGAEINNNEAGSIGGIAAEVTNSSGDFSIVNTHFTNNQGGSGGGAVGVMQATGGEQPISSSGSSQNIRSRLSVKLQQANAPFQRGTAVPLILGCTFENNGANTPDVGDAGAILLDGVDVMVMDCNFFGNTANVDGGAIKCANGAAPMIAGCDFQMNRSDALTLQGGGGAIQNDNSNPMILECNFSGNTCPINDAGAIYNVNGANPFIQNCNFIANSSRIDGGAIKNENNCNPMITDCTFELNTTTNTAFNAGGAIMNEGSHPIIENCDFIMNSSREGGAIFCFDFEPTMLPSQLTLIECTFDRNSSEFSGGAVRAENGTVGSIASCMFIANEAGSGGAVSCSNSEIEIADCQFNSNIANLGDGGAIGFFNGPATISACTFENNSAMDDGGAVDTNADNPTISQCIFRFNHCNDNGGALFLNSSTAAVQFSQFIGNDATDLAGAIAGFNGSVSTIIGCSFAGNTCGFDGGATLFSSSSPTSYFSCEFTGNSAANSGGAVVCPGSGHEINNCTFSNNSALVEGGAVLCNSTSNTTINNSILWNNEDEIHVATGSTLTVTFSNVQGGFTGVGNMDSDPHFQDPLGTDGIAGTTDDDLRLRSDSPMIDAGNNDVVPLDALDVDGDGNFGEPVPFDLNMLIRFADNPNVPDVGIGNAPIIDIGAIEFSELLLGDVNLDGAVNLLDVGPFIDRLASGDYQEEADCNLDGVLNLLDVEPFVEILAN